jgi:4'-phosphopantetheinyl transferase
LSFVHFIVFERAKVITSAVIINFIDRKLNPTPLPVIQNITPAQCIVALWQIDESEEDLLRPLNLTAFEEKQLKGMIGSKRRTQWLAVRNLLIHLLGENAQIAYSEHGRPHLENNPHHIGISHSGIYAAVQLSKEKPCGIDIQEWSPKMERLYPKFVNDFEEEFIRGDRFQDYLNLIWTLKESVYKYYGSEVEFKTEMKVLPFQLNASGTCEVEVTRWGKEAHFQLAYHRIDNYYLSYLL